MAWKIENTETFYHRNNRFYELKYQQITFWFNDETLERKETSRVEFIQQGQEYKLPDWTKVAVYRKDLNVT